MPLRTASDARRTTPAPASNRYARSLTTIAVAGPDRSGSGSGVPVPRNTTCVPLGAFTAAGCAGAAAGWAGDGAARHPAATMRLTSREALALAFTVSLGQRRDPGTA